MHLTIFSDVHGNLPALRAMLKHTKATDGYICLGDVVGYGPWSNECVDIVRALPNIIYIQGNHEKCFATGYYDGNNEIAKAFFDFCYPFFNRKNEIKNLKKSYNINGFSFRHALFNKNIYPDSIIKLDNNYVIGHSHYQFEIDQVPFKLYNVGSVGQNRKYINIINYMVLDTDTSQFTQFAIKYNENIIINKMRKNGYPQICIDYYNNKQRL